MSVNQSQVKGNENVSTLSRTSRLRVQIFTFVHTSSHSHLTKSLDMCLPRECKPSMKRDVLKSIYLKIRILYACFLGSIEQYTLYSSKTC